MATPIPTVTAGDRPAPAAAAPAGPPTRRRIRFRPGVRHGFLLLAAFVWLLPVLWMVSMALTPNDVQQREPVGLLPDGLTWSNFADVFQLGLMLRWFGNSVVVTTAATVLTVAVCAMAGYAFAKLRFTGRRLLFAVVIAGLMVPREAMFVPLFLMFSDTGQQNTYQALFLPRVAFPLGVFIMTQFFSRVPDEYEEAARVDGAGPLRVFWSIMLPLARPAMASLAIFTFVLTWNDYLWPLVIATEQEMFTVTTGLASLQSNFAAATEIGSLMARGLIGSLPLVVLFLLFQRQLIRGITLGSGEK
ncbi:MAG: ABC transporter, permease protein 2 (cluster 1, maltose/g3p/polyamine/iron) [uncultured Corynebacteriales bacterium]|uniref:ABC transporter, permease protein 2 (Cluster 1, maltose/g3p/polyamine/iron) n=1 Tax=uncultured Mycobacteriales bacterium TaxID=581187 RepID=A0A6J4I8D5_9ACTN|nr:MAG: ABC transporter, permease protein 2 (cluster 1, maltose/g3p/polyamine/iron) [uncultured Corynebacteriales bacterium]